MKRTSEVDEIEAALKRAAYKATHGTREERSGRFLPAKKARGSSPDGGSKPSGETRHKGTVTRGR
jgi:hypothetical protein